jgi:hypothetical protein
MLRLTGFPRAQLLQRHDGLLVVKNPLSVVIVVETVGSQTQSTGSAIEQGYPEMSFQLLDLARYCRRRHTHHQRRFTEAGLFHYMGECLHSLKPIHIHYLTKCSIKRAE